VAKVRTLGVSFDIKAPYACTVTAVHEPDGAAVEYGQPLLTLYSP
jgi:biotin carboxyl carrier protein